MIDKPAPDTQNIFPGMTVKNYKELCTLIGESPTTGNAKKAQLSRWAQYFSFEKNPNQKSFLIKEVYPMPLPKEESNAGRKSIYLDHIEKILCNHLLSMPRYTNTLTPNQWFKTLGMINDNYKKLKEEDLEALDESFTEYNINSFYNSYDRKLNSTLRDALQRLKRRGIIEFFETYKLKYSQRGRYFTATEGDLDSIEYVENLALEYLGIPDKHQLYSNQKYDKYKELRANLAKDEYGYYSIYKIVKIKLLHENFNDIYDIILSNEELEDERMSLNSALINYFISKSQKKQSDWEYKYIEGCAYWYPYNFLISQCKLADLLIKISRRKRFALIDWREYIEYNKDYEPDFDVFTVQMSDSYYYPIETVKDDYNYWAKFMETKAYNDDILNKATVFDLEIINLIKELETDFDVELDDLFGE